MLDFVRPSFKTDALNQEGLKAEYAFTTSEDHDETLADTVNACIEHTTEKTLQLPKRHAHLEDDARGDVCPRYDLLI